MSVNNKWRRAGEILSDIMQRDTYNLSTDRKLRENSLKNVYLADTTKLHGRPTLDLGMRELGSVPKQTFHQKNLQILKLSGNYLRSLPFELATLRYLQELYVQNNKLEFIPAQICALVNLQVLDVSYNDITMLPYSISHLRNLRVLDVAYNRISILPDSLAFLNVLEYLDVDGNGLTEIPDTVCKLSSLMVLRMRENKLRSVPKSITKLKKLRELCLTENRIEHIPASVKIHLQRIAKLDIEPYLLTKQITTQESNEHDRKGHSRPTKLTESKQNGLIKNDIPVMEYSENGDPIYSFTSFAFGNMDLTKEKETQI